MIQLNNIEYSYPKSDFNIKIESMLIEKKSRTAFIGPSGYGKTTLLNLIAGILLPEKGEVSVNDQKVNSLNENERRNFRISDIGFVFQDFKLLSYLNVLDNIILPFRINSVLQLNAEVRDKAKDLAENLNIGDKLTKYPSKLSHGERQRVAIARALLNQPKVILADEPTGNLDPDNKKHIIDILFDYVEKYDSTLITVTHDHDLLDGFGKVVDFKGLRE